MQNSAVYVFSSFSVLDRVSCKSELAKAISPARIVLTVLFATFFCDDAHQVVIYHCQIDDERRTFLKGKWIRLGLGEYSSHNYEVISSGTYDTPPPWLYWRATDTINVDDIYICESDNIITMPPIVITQREENIGIVYLGDCLAPVWLMSKSM